MHLILDPTQCSDMRWPNGHENKFLDIMKHQNGILTQQQFSFPLSPRERPIFDGDPLEYRTFIRTFHHNVEGKTASSVDCLELVQSCQYMSPHRGYQRARILLEQHFGNEQKITSAYMKKALGWSTNKYDDIKPLQAFGLFLCVVMEFGC